jgi:hypothetical protein
LGAVTNFDRIDLRLDLYERHEEQLSIHRFRSIQSPFFVMWWSYEVAGRDLLEIETGALAKHRRLCGIDIVLLIELTYHPRCHFHRLYTVDGSVQFFLLRSCNF